MMVCGWRLLLLAGAGDSWWLVCAEGMGIGYSLTKGVVVCVHTQQWWCAGAAMVFHSFKNSGGAGF